MDAVTSATSFTVVEAIGDSTGGTCTAKYPPGARKVGLDPTGMGNVSSTNVQGAVEELDTAVSGGILFDEDNILVSADGNVLVNADGNVLLSG